MSCEPHWSIAVTSEPSTEPITLTEAKAHCRVDDTADDTYITALIVAARIHVENFLAKKLITQTLSLKLDEFPNGAREIKLPYGPVQSVTSISYTDANGSAATFTDYRSDLTSFIPRLTPSYGYQWPVAQYITNAVAIVYVAGYGTASAVPANIKHAIKLLVGHWYESREAVVTGTIVAELPMAVATLLSAEKGDWL